MSDPLKVSLTFSCLSCGRVVESTLSDVRNRRTVRCPAGHPVKLSEQGGGIRRLDRSLDQLNRSSERLNRRFK
jgi:hypothetical protein